MKRRAPVRHRKDRSGRARLREVPVAAANDQSGDRRTVLSFVLARVLDLAAVGGAICIVLVLLAVLLHITLILFRTGSMAPAIPQGSVAVVRETPATDVEIGDVVTVDRPGDAPVSHRVVRVEPHGGESVELTLRGDANPGPDPRPYEVTTVRLVLFHIPGLAPFIAGLGRPPVMIGVTLAVAALVVWALWPRKRARTTEGETGEETQESGRDVEPVDGSDAEDRRAEEAEPR